MLERTPDLIGVFSALGSAAAWAMGAVLYKRIGEKIDASGMNLVKSVLSIPFLLLPLLAIGARLPGLHVCLILGLSGLLGIAVGDTLFFISLQELGAHVLVVLCTFGQALTVALAVAVLGERLSMNRWLGIGMIIGGVGAVLDANRSRPVHAFRPRGVALGLLSVVCMAVSVIMAKPALASVSALEGAAIRMLGGVAGLMFWGAFGNGLGSCVMPFRNTGLLRDILFAVCVSSLGGFWLFHVALKHLDAAVANTLGSLEPLFALPMAAVFLKERIERKAVAGAIVSVGGVVILALRG